MTRSRFTAYVHLNASAAEKAESDPTDAQKIKDSIKKHVADAKINYKHLGEVEFIAAIPKTPSGKLLRKDCELKGRSKA